MSATNRPFRTKRLPTDLPDRKWTARVRQHIHMGVSANKTHQICGGQRAKVYAIARDVWTGGHELDPVDDWVAIERVLHTGCPETFARMSAFEQQVALARIYAESESPRAKYRGRGWYRRLAMGLGYKDAEGMLHMGRLAYELGYAA